MRPEKKEFERVPVGEFINGIIADVEYEKDHVFKFQGKEMPGMGVRLILNLNGLKDVKKTRWMKLTYSANSTVYKKYLQPLVDNISEYFDFDMDQLLGMKIKTIWADDEDPKYQSIQIILPQDKKVIYDPGFQSERVPVW